MRVVHNDPSAKPTTWDQWAARQVRIAKIVTATARRQRADPWARKLHSMAVAARLARRLRSRPVPPRRRRVPRTWEQWGCIQLELLRQKARAVRKSPWDKWAAMKIGQLLIRRRRCVDQP